MISSIKQYKKGETNLKIDKLVPNELYKKQNYCKESLDLIFDYSLSGDYDFKLLISSYSKIELLEETNVYKQELIKLWEHQFNIKFSNFWNIYYGITKKRIIKEGSHNQSPTNNWEERLGVDKKSTDPIDFRISLLERSGKTANTSVERKEIISSNDDIVENSTLNAMRSPFLTNSAEEKHNKNVDSIGNINMLEKNDEIDQSPDPHLLEFLYGNDKVEKKETIVNKKKIEEFENSNNNKKKKKKHFDETANLNENVDRLADVNLDDFYTSSKTTAYTHEFYTESFKNSMKGPNEDEILDLNFFDNNNLISTNEKQNIISINEKKAADYQDSYEKVLKHEMSVTTQVNNKDKVPVIKKGTAKPKLSEMDAKKEALKELKSEVEYKKQLHKLNQKNTKIIKKRKDDSLKSEQKEKKERIDLGKKQIEEYNKISSIENEIKLDKLIGKKSGIVGKNKTKLRQEAYVTSSIEEQKEIFEINSKLIETQNEITNMDKSLIKDKHD